MTRSRLIDVVTVVVACGLGGVVLYGLGTPIAASAVIAVLAMAATGFTRWARARYRRSRTSQHKP